MRRIARDVARAQRARETASRRQQADYARAARAEERQAKADAKESDRLHALSRQEEADELTRATLGRGLAIETLLDRALRSNPAINLLAGLRTFVPGEFDESPWRSGAPDRSAFLPKPLGFVGRLLPGADDRHQRRMGKGMERFILADAGHQARMEARDEALHAFRTDEYLRKKAVADDNAGINDHHRRLLAAEHDAVIAYFQLVLDGGLKGEPDAVAAEIGYSADSRHLVVDLELPDISVIPDETGFRYVKASDRIEPIAQPAAKKRTLYSSLISQVALKAIDTVYRSTPPSVVEVLTLNGMLDTIDPATGRQVRLCLLSVRVAQDVFMGLNLRQVQPEQCLRSLKASVSRSPAELVAVKPLVELDMVDPRFVDTVDVMSGLEGRPNLMDLTPNEFEGLITNLFAAMGLDTRQTRASRDGGVDCVAFDTRPVFGGKVVIQAKRYKNTVGVSAVRDLFGTVQNEGASKGILVTTSGYGKAAFEFAKGKPLELLDGGNLLHLLAEHADIEARIVMPEGWVDLPLYGD